MGQYLTNFKLGEEYRVGHLCDAIHNELGFVPYIDSIDVPSEKRKYLSEIHLNFDQHKNLINANKPNTNLSEKVVYLCCGHNNFALPLPN